MRVYTAWSVCVKCKLSGPHPTVYCDGSSFGIPKCESATNEHFHRLCDRCKFSWPEALAAMPTEFPDADNVVPFPAGKV